MSNFFLAWTAVFILNGVGHPPETFGALFTLLLGLAIDLGPAMFRAWYVRKAEAELAADPLDEDDDK
jgi:hypothetical protein